MFFCVSYEQNVNYFTNPKSWVSVALLQLHDYMMFFLLNILVIVLVFSYISVTYIQDIHKSKNNLKLFLLFNMKRYNHAPFIEFFWTFVPIILLFCMGWPSFKILYAVEQLVDPYHTVIIVGNQWYWTYQYSDFDIVTAMIQQLDVTSTMSLFIKKHISDRVLVNALLIKNEFIRHFDNRKFLNVVGKNLRKYDEAKVMYDSVIISDENLPKGYPRMLSADQVLILPAGISIRLLVTSSDVIHSWAMPAFGYKMDAIPGRINQIAFIVPFWGTYWGQCSELCGINHGYMPIEVRVFCFSDYLTFIQLNFSFKYDLFWPLLKKIFYAYSVYHSFFVETSKFEFYDFIFEKKPLSSELILDLCENKF